MRYGGHTYSITHKRRKEYLSKDRKHINLVLYTPELNFRQVTEQWKWLKHKIETTPFIDYKLTEFTIEKHQVVITELNIPL